MPAMLSRSLKLGRAVGLGVAPGRCHARFFSATAQVLKTYGVIGLGRMVSPLQYQVPFIFFFFFWANKDY